MARDISSIQETIQEQVHKHLPELSNNKSDTAEWRLWTFVMASVCNFMEQLMDQFQKDINTLIDDKRLGSATWYVHVAKQFQKGHELRVFPNGTLGYERIEHKSRIISHASFKEIKSSGSIILKVSKLVSGELAPLALDEKSMFEAYIEKIKLAGTKIEVVSLEADRLQIHVKIYYNHMLEANGVKSEVQLAIKNYCANLGYDGKVLYNDLLQVIRAAKGVQDAVIIQLTGWQGSLATSITPIIRAYETQSGYINFNEVQETTNPSRIELL